MSELATIMFIVYALPIVAIVFSIIALCKVHTVTVYANALEKELNELKGKGN